MKKRLTFIYVFLGFILGWVIGHIDTSNNGTSYKHLFYFICFILIIRAFFWLNDFIQKHIKDNWTVIRARGKFRYITLYSYLTRGILFFIFMFVAPFLTIGFDRSVINYLIPTLIIFIGFLYLLGAIEWQSNELAELEKTH